MPIGNTFEKKYGLPKEALRAKRGDKPMSEQNELLTTPEEIVVNKRIIRKWHRFKATYRFQCSYWDCPNYIEIGDNYYADHEDEQEPYCQICSATFMMLSSNELLKAQLAKVFKHKLDRPDREKIARELCKADGYGWKRIDSWIVRHTSNISQFRYYRMADQIEALFPDGCANCDTPLLREGELYQKLKEAKREERERILDKIDELSNDGEFFLTTQEIRQALKEENNG